MSVKTCNAYGHISISDEAIAKVTAHATLDCYGIVELVSKRFSDSLLQLLGKEVVRGVNVVTNGDRIFIDVYVIIKFGI